LRFCVFFVHVKNAKVPLPPTTHHLPPTTHHLPPTTHHLPPTTHHLSPATCHPLENFPIIRYNRTYVLLWKQASSLIPTSSTSPVPPSTGLSPASCPRARSHSSLASRAAVNPSWLWISPSASPPPALPGKPHPNHLCPWSTTARIPPASTSDAACKPSLPASRPMK